MKPNRVDSTDDRLPRSVEPSEQDWGRAAATIAIVLAMLAAFRAILTFVPNMTSWGMNTMRFLPPGVAWGTWAIAALALIPALGRRLAHRRPTPQHKQIVPSRGWVLGLAVLAGVGLVLLIPDRTWYVGDFLMRQGAIVERKSFDLFKQALPLDVAIHYRFRLWLWETIGLDARYSARLIGLLDAAALSLIAARLPTVLGLKGLPALASATTLFFGGYLVLFSGYAKSVVELAVLTAAVGVTGLEVLRTGRGVLGFGIVLSLALPLHRSAVALMPAALFVWIHWLRHRRARLLTVRPATVVGLVLPWVVLATVIPRIVRTFIDVDMPVHLAPAAVHAGGVWRSAFGGLRSLDFMNVIMLLSPLAPIIPAGVAVLARDPARRPELGLLLLLILPLLAFMPFIHPAQGMVRDWDSFLALGVSTSLLAAWVVGEVLRGAPRWAWLGLAASLAAIAPTLQWMMVHADSDRGIRRIHAFLVEPPPRTELERGLAFDFLGIRHLRNRESDQAAAMFREAIALIPTPRLYHQWALAEFQAGNESGAMRAYDELLARTPNDVVAWRGYITMASRLQKWPEAKRGATRLLQLVPGDSESLELLDAIERQGLLPDSARARSN